MKFHINKEIEIRKLDTRNIGRGMKRIEKEKREVVIKAKKGNVEGMNDVEREKPQYCKRGDEKRIVMHGSIK